MSAPGTSVNGGERTHPRAGDQKPPLGETAGMSHRLHLKQETHKWLVYERFVCVDVAIVLVVSKKV